MKEQRADVFLFYHDRREAVERLAGVSTITFVLIAALSRSVVTKATANSSATKTAIDPVTGQPLPIPPATAETWDIFGGGIDNSFLIVFGPLVITVIAIWFNRLFTNCFAIRRSLLQTVKDGQLGETTHSAFEQTLIAPPLSTSSDGIVSKCLRFSLPRAVFFVGLVCAVILLAEYASFRPKDIRLGSGLSSVLLGSPLFHGFEPKWWRYPDKKIPWIYPPWYTVCYALMLGYLTYKTICPPKS